MIGWGFGFHETSLSSTILNLISTCFSGKGRKLVVHIMRIRRTLKLDHTLYLINYGTVINRIQHMVHFLEILITCILMIFTRKACIFKLD